MAGRLYAYECAVAAGTPAASPASFSLAVPPQRLTRALIRVPPGPRGVVGWQLWYGGSLAFPYQRGAWVVADDAQVAIEPPADMTSGAWRLVAYNTGAYSHTLYVELYTEDAVAAAAAVTVTVPVYIAPATPALPPQEQPPPEQPPQEIPPEEIPPEEIPLEEIPPEEIPPEEVPPAPAPAPAPPAPTALVHRYLDVPIAVYNHRAQWEAGWDGRKQWLTTSDAPRKRGFVRLAVPIDVYNHRHLWVRGWDSRKDWRI